VADLEPTVEELRLSLRRLAAADDAERRRLERELHDGAQQRLVAVRVKLGLLRELVPADEELSGRFDELESVLHDAFRALRELAYDIYPPVLAAEGAGAALRAVADRCAVPVTVDASVGRYPSEIEWAVYHSCSEALRRVTAHGCTASLFLGEEDGELVFVVTNVDEDPRVEDRVRAVGGRVELDGDTLRGRVPLSGVERP
jgi:signal transduction histidine kinase